MRSQTGVVTVHAFPVRLTHWLNAVAMGCMISSGWGIYNANAFFGFTFPRWATLGGWLGGSIAWHFAAMWLLVVNGLAYIVYGVASRHFARALFPVSSKSVWRDFRAALAFRLTHRPGSYNAVQRLAYLVALLLGVLLVASGLALWKPVQFQTVSSLLGGYEASRRVHFLAMSGMVLFVIVHLALVAVVPSTMISMVTGRSRVAPGAEVRT